MKIKQNKAITLIALVLTIIILLILAGVTIATLAGENGIIAQTIKTQEETKKAEYREKINLIIQEETISKMIEEKQDLLIDGIVEQIKTQEWQETVTISNNEFKEPQNNGEKTIIIINTKDGYEIIIKVDNKKIEAEIVSIIKGKAKTYTVIYNANNGTNDKIEETVREGFSTEVIANIYQRDGYEFVGWSTDKNATEIEYVQGNIIENITEDVNLYAIWSKTTATITFNGNNITSTQIVSKGVNTPLKEFSTTGITKEGYAFIGWSEIENGEVKYEDGVEIIITQDINLYAVWEEDSVSAGLSITNGNSSTNDLTKGTTISIQVESTRSEIASTKLEMIKDGTIVAKIYENLSGGKQQNIILDGLEEDLINLDKLTICDTYDCKLTSITESGAISEQVISLTDYTVSTANDLNVLASNVNNGEHYSGKTIILLNDVTTTQNYIPIGYWNGGNVFAGQYFSGTFEGNKHCITISSVTTDSMYYASGVFGMVIGGNIYNLTVKGTNASAIPVTGGISGSIKNGKIDNCINECEITDTTQSRKGGIVGYVENSEITNCINKAEINGSTSIGGICGYIYASSKVENCINAVTGDVFSYGIEVLNWTSGANTHSNKYYGITGGIVGKCNNSNIINCSNNGRVNAKPNGEYGKLSGGIVGYALNNSIIQLSDNSGEISYYLSSGTTSNGGGLGGIVGFLNTSDVEKCYNTGSITSININGNKSMNNIGGIIGYGYSVSLKNCYNRGEIRGNDYVGGIAGYIEKYAGSKVNYAYNCYNASTTIVGNSYVGNWGGYFVYGTGSHNSIITGYEWIGHQSNCTWESAMTYSQSEMSTIDNLLNYLNQGNGSGVWARSNSINDGYPYLIENTP